MDFKATGITSTVEADSFLNELCRVSGGEVPAFFLMERREQRGSMLLDGALRIWFCPVEGQQFVWPDEVVVRLLEPDPKPNPNPSPKPNLDPSPNPNSD